MDNGANDDGDKKKEVVRKLCRVNHSQLRRVPSDDNASAGLTVVGKKIKII